VTFSRPYRLRRRGKGGKGEGSDIPVSGKPYSMRQGKEKEKKRNLRDYHLLLDFFRVDLCASG